MLRIFFLFLCIFAQALFCEQALCAPRINTQEVPTKINADKMNYDADKNLVIFTGNVIVERAEFKLWANTISIYLKSSGAKSTSTAKNTSTDPMGGMKSGDIDKIIANNNVRMRYNSNTGTCGRAIYDVDKAILTMQQNPVLKEGSSSITGEEIRYYMNDNKSEIIGGKKRVEAFFN